MSHPEHWAISGLLAAVFVVANSVNVSLLMRARRNGEEDARGSPILLIGGIGGAMSFALSPSESSFSMSSPCEWDELTCLVTCEFIQLARRKATVSRAEL